uniref:Uncharacterized protein n=1 Tax=Oryza barthii TaxID=65489 RepID=A0A0D3HS81_9ORYZ
MASRILPGFFRRRRSSAVVPAATKEEMLELEIAPAAAYELEPVGHRPCGGKRRHWTPEQVAREAEKQRWIAEEKRRIEKETKRQQQRRSSGFAVVVVVDLDKELGEEFERTRFYEELRLQQAEARRAAASKVVTTTEEEDDDDDVPARGDEGYLERRRELLGRYRLT